MNDLKNQTNFEINQVINTPYKYGFQTSIEKEDFPYGINENIITLLSSKKNEPDFLTKFRLKAYHKWINLKAPTWSNLSIQDIKYNEIKYYSIPKQKKVLN
jgi:Fe-S cluster assembly protein SufB